MAKVMIVDDEKMLLESFSRILIAEGYETKLASSGMEALGFLEGYMPDVILLDIRMPEIDGLEVCNRIRTHKNERIKNMPIIMITGYHYAKEEIIKAGADDFLEKPIERAEMLIRVKSAIKIGKLSDELERTKAYLEELKKAGKGE